MAAEMVKEKGKMAEDLYKALGVPKSATADEIRKAYRKIAKASHPDLNPGDKAAEARFKAAQAAWDILGDPDKRARYDRGEIDAAGQERTAQQFWRRYADAKEGTRYQSESGYADFADFSDIFSDLFARGAGAGGAGGTAGAGRIRTRGQDRRYHLEVDFLDAARGTTRRITVPRGGPGGGPGAGPGGATLDVTIPAGVQDGTVLRLKGKGAPGLGGGPAGDALVELAVRPHRHFVREGDDIVLELPITLDEAVLGAKIEVPTIGGRVQMTVPKGSSSGDVLRLKGRGLKTKTGSGDQRVVLRVVMPERVDAELEKFVKGWREKHPYDPRAELRRET
jgi:DnaJ-class molecular chaperone